MKKIFALLLLVAMAFSIVACGPKNVIQTEKPIDPNPDNTATAEKVRYEVPANGYDGSEVTITFSHTMGEALRKELDKAIERFNEIYPNITVEHTQVGGYDEVRDQIKTELTAGNQPNIAYCYPDHVALYNVTKKVVPLDNFIESQIPDSATGGIIGLTEEQKADFITSYYNEGTVFDVAGTMYTMPMSKSTEVLYYNATFFQENGLTVPTTWAELEQVCADIKAILASDDNPNNDADVPLGYDSESNWFITMCEQYGSNYTSTDPSNHFLFNNKTNRDFVKMFREWYEKGYVTTQEIYGAYTSSLFTNTDPTKPTCYMCIGSTGGASHQTPPVVDGQYKFTVGIAAIPQVNPDAPKAISQGPSLCIFDQNGDSDNFDNGQEVIASWLFVKFLTTDAKFQASFSMVSGYMPVINSVKTIDAYAKWLNGANGTDKLGALVIKTALENTESYFVSPAFNGSSKARDQVGVLIQYCFTNSPANGVSVDDFILEAFQKAIAECLSDT